MNWLKRQYQTNGWFRGFVQAVEGGALAGLATATAAGFDLSKKGLTVLVASVGTSILVAIRNYLVNRPGSPAGPVAPGTEPKSDTTSK